MTNSKNSRMVYSTETGSICPKCGNPKSNCSCSKKKTEPAVNANPFPTDGTIRIRREKQGRKGKTVTAIYGLPLAEDETVALSRTLKRRCGTGGTVKDGAIFIQGDHREALAKELRTLGYSVKLAGG